MYVDQLFDEITRLPEDRREHAITERCAGFPAIEREVRALVAAHDNLPSEAPTLLDLAAGTELGHFQLEERLGQGATASVWRAWDSRIEAYTALKLLDPGIGLRGQRALEAVLHEARAASSIISDHVIRIKTAGTFDAGPHYVEMELCAERRPRDDGTEVLVIGRSLAEVPLTGIEEKVRVVSEAARGVDAAHRVGVLHRDLKPGNILLTPVSRRAKVVDFGLAAEQLYPSPGPDVPVHRTVTVLLEATDGKVVGTPAYMPPEQAFGHPPTRATDVYALGATLYALIVDDHPYVARGEARVPALDVLAQVRRGPPARIGRRARVPRRLERILETAMARSARDRYATAGALADDLDAWRLGFASSVDGRAPLLRLGLLGARHKGLAATGMVGMCGVLGFGAALGWLEVERRALEGRIAQSRVELVVSQGMAHIADAARERAQAAAALSEAAWRQALRGESNAEQRWRQEVTAREEAERAWEAEAAARVLLEGDLAVSRSESDRLDDALGRQAEVLAGLDATLRERTAALAAAEAELEAAREATDVAEAEAAEARGLAATRAQRIEQLTLEVERLVAEVAYEQAARREVAFELELLRETPSASPREGGVP